MEFNPEMTHTPITKVLHRSTNRVFVWIVCCLALVNGFFCLSPGQSYVDLWYQDCIESVLAKPVAWAMGAFLAWR
jgi:hypothetical protein